MNKKALMLLACFPLLVLAEMYSVNFINYMVSASSDIQVFVGILSLCAYLFLNILGVRFLLGMKFGKSVKKEL